MVKKIYKNKDYFYNVSRRLAIIYYYFYYYDTLAS